MDFINFITKLTPHTDSYLMETIVAGYKTIFEYQTDMFLSDEEAKAKDAQAEYEYNVRDALADFVDNDVSIDDIDSIDEYLSDYPNDAFKLIQIILKKSGVDSTTKELVDGDVLILYNNIILNFSNGRFLSAYSKKSFYDRIVDDPDSYLPKGFPDLEEKFNDEFWDGPVELYHATTEDNVADIQSDGLVPMSSTRGISNRSVGSAVFTSINPDVIDSYGDNVFRIDTTAMKRDGYTPYVSQEPVFPESEKINALLHIYDIEETHEISSYDGMDPDTVIVYGKIPSKYLELT